MSVAIGIDLGTTNTVVAAVVDGVAVTLEDEHGRRLLPSVVSFHPSSTVLVGEPARERRLIDPENTVFSVKPLLGRSFDSDEVVAARKRFPFRLVQGAKNSTTVLARDVAYALPEISAFVLRRAKSIAESALGQPIDRAVITVPANFNDLQRASTKIAGKLAGLDVLRILNEPTAAALAYGQSISKAEKIGVYDLGGGTFDVTLLDLTGNVFEVLATAGDTALGGDDIDRALADRIALEIIKRFNVDPRMNPAAAARLTFVAEELKKDLSSVFKAEREITDIGYGEGGRSISMPFVMTRDELERIAEPLVRRTVAVAKQSMESVGLSPRDFDRILLVGGSTRMPLVGRMVEQVFGQPPHLKVNPDEVVALGAAIQAHALNRTKSAHKRRSAHDQLAKAQPKASPGAQPTRPPDVNPDVGVTAPAIPRSPPVPDLGRREARPSDKPAAAEFFTFNKAPAVISFSDIPPAGAPPTKPGPNHGPAPLGQTSPFGQTPGMPNQARPMARAQRPATSPDHRPPPLPKKAPGTASSPGLGGGQVPASPSAAKPGVPRPPSSPKVPALPSAARPSPVGAPTSTAVMPAAAPGTRTAVMPAMGRGQTDHAQALDAGGAGGASRAVRPIEGRTVHGADAPVGPKPARGASMPVPELSLGPSDIVAAPDLDFPPPDLAPPGAADLDLDFDLPGSDMMGGAQPTSHSVATDDFFDSLELEPSSPAALSARSPLVPEELMALQAPPELQHFQQGSAIATSAATPLLIDVTPLSLGVETAGGYADVLIPANSPVPCEKTRTFLTASDQQTMVSIRVAQGESTRFSQNTRLGDLELTGLRRAARGEVKVAVTFELDVDGILNVRARDQDTGRETVATMRLLGDTTDTADVGAMAERQARHVVA